MLTWTLSFFEESVLPTVRFPVTFSLATEGFGVLDLPGFDACGFLFAAPPGLQKFPVSFASFSRVISGF
jgi:hypothetical protein